MSTTMITLTCKNCKNEFEKELYEVNRQINSGQTNFYCNSKCAGQYINTQRKKPEVTKICPVCNKQFTASTKAKGATYCSRSCASKGSVNEKRRQAGRNAVANNFTPDTHTITGIRDLLIKRESWKYVELKKLLSILSIKHEFEYIIGNYIYDVALIDSKILVEFDGPDHSNNTDSNKDANAFNNGWQLQRLDVVSNTIIDSRLLLPIIKDLVV